MSRAGTLILPFYFPSFQSSWHLPKKILCLLLNVKPCPVHKYHLQSPSYSYCCNQLIKNMEMDASSLLQVVEWVLTHSQPAKEKGRDLHTRRIKCLMEHWNAVVLSDILSTSIEHWEEPAHEPSTASAWPPITVGWFVHSFIQCFLLFYKLKCHLI